MKEFNLEKALNGEPVKLACGRKAYILYDLSKYPELLKHANRRPLNGLVMSDCKDNDCYPANRLLDGKNLFDQDDVIEMWEEPKKQTKNRLALKIYLSRLSLNVMNRTFILMAALLSMKVNFGSRVVLISKPPKEVTVSVQQKMLKNGLIL